MAKKLVILAVVALVLALGWGVASSFLFGPSDKEMIRATIVDATDAAREGRPSPVLDALSLDFEYDGDLANRFDVAKVVRESKPDVTVLNMEPSIDGETALVVSDVRLETKLMGGFPINGTIKDVRISLERETGRKWLVVPVPKWRITKVEAAGLPSY